MEGAEDDSLCYSLERQTFLPAESASDGSSYIESACVPNILKSLWFLSPISFLHKPRELCDIVLLNTSIDLLSDCVKSNFLSAPPYLNFYKLLPNSFCFSMYNTINAATPKKRGVGGVNNGIAFNCSNIAPYYLNWHFANYSVISIEFRIFINLMPNWDAFSTPQ